MHGVIWQQQQQQKIRGTDQTTKENFIWKSVPNFSNLRLSIWRLSVWTYLLRVTFLLLFALWSEKRNLHNKDMVEADETENS